MNRPTPDRAGPGQESVWDYPRPAIAQANARHLVVRHRGVTIAKTRAGFRTIETSHPPTYYFPPADIAQGVLRPSGRRSLCEWKGQAVYFDVTAGGETMSNAAWAYPHPTRAFAAMRDHVAFYPALFDTCLVDGESVVAQPGGFYGGWITTDLAGPFKGVPGSRFW